jgi:hypothetical protein
MKPKLNVSFSGGRTSAVMTKRCLEKYGQTHEILVTFANTGCEHLDTLRFIDDCDRHWGFNVVWLEAEINPEKGIGVGHKIVTYDTAARNGEPFEAFIAKYGIPNMTNPSCTARLKTDVIESYLQSKGFLRGKKLNYDTAIGIRADEIDRISVRRHKERFIYPMADEGWTKQMVVDYMKQFPWDLQIPEHLGNCTWCWKKNHRKLLTLAQDYPEVFNFPAKMEEKYSTFKADCAAGHNGKRMFFRKQLTTQDILKEAAKGEFKRFADPNFSYTSDFDPDYDLNIGCSESCEVYPTDGS